MDGGDKPIRVGTKYHLVEKNGLKSDWTVVLIVEPKAIRHRIDLGVWDGGTVIVGADADRRAAARASGS